MYGKNSAPPDSKIFAGVQVDAISGRLGQMLRADLEDQLNPGGAVPANPVYRLVASLDVSEGAIGVSRDGTVSRYNVYLSSHYVLYRTADNKPIASGDLRHVNSYNNVTNAYFSTYISEQDADNRGVDELSVMYRQRLGDYLDAGAPVQKKIQIKAPAATVAPATASPWMPNATPGYGAPPPPLQ